MIFALRPLAFAASIIMVSPLAFADLTSDIKAAVRASECSSYRWLDRGVASEGYVQGVAITYARALCHPERPEVKAASVAADSSVHKNDGLLAYASKFQALGFDNKKSGSTALRSTYAMLIGLGVRESSGKFCEGRDVSMCFSEADSAEAGLIQTSFGASKALPDLRDLFDIYKNNRRDCLVDEFGGPKICRVRKSSNPDCPDTTSDVAGSGPGAEWQRLTKTCPAFAVEYGAVILRKKGGSGSNGTPKGEFGPIRTGKVELISACVAMLEKIELIVVEKPEGCKIFN
jgi:hypothetical protein